MIDLLGWVLLIVGPSLVIAAVLIYSTGRRGADKQDRKEPR